MMLLETTTVPEATLPLSDFKAHLRMGTGFADDGAQDAVLYGFLRASLSAIRGFAAGVVWRDSRCWPEHCECDRALRSATRRWRSTRGRSWGPRSLVRRRRDDPHGGGLHTLK